MSLKLENLRNIDWKSYFWEIWVQYKCFWKAFYLILMHSIHKKLCFEEFLHEMICFSKIWFSIASRLLLDQSNVTFDQSNLIFDKLKIVQRVFLKNINFSRVCHYPNFFKKFFLSLFDRSRFKAKFFVVFPQISSRVFDF